MLTYYIYSSYCTRTEPVPHSVQIHCDPCVTCELNVTFTNACTVEPPLVYTSQKWTPPNSDGRGTSFSRTTTVQSTLIKVFCNERRDDWSHIAWNVLYNGNCMLFIKAIIYSHGT